MPIGSPRKANAEALINYYYEPEVAAEVAAWVNYITPGRRRQGGRDRDRPRTRREPAHLPERGDAVDTRTIFRTLTARRSRSTARSSRASCWARERVGRRVRRDAAPTSSSWASRSGSPGSRRSRSSTSRSPPGRSSRCSVRPVAARRRRCGWSRASRSPTAGRILIGGNDVTDTKSHERPVNTVFQSYALFPHMTIIENVAFGLKRRGIADAVGRAHEALRLVELDHLAQRRPAAALRRPAAAGRARARDREPPGAPAAR